MPLGNPIRKQNESRMVSVLATEGQTVFTVQGGYIINQLSVFRNGVRLSPAEDFTAGDGSTVTLNNAANIDDRIDFHIFDRFTVQNAIIGAASTQTINGDLVLNGKLFGALDVPSINLTGIITTTNLNVTGVSTFKDDVEFHGVNGISSITFDKSANNLVFKDNAKAAFGDSSDLIIFHNGTLSKIQNSSSGQLEIISNDIDLRSSTGDKNYFTAQVGGAATVFYDNSVRIATSPSGADVTGTLNVTGISTLGSDVSIADKIIHTGDTNTAIRFPAADTITAETGGSERLRITSDGKIGINSTTPTFASGGGVQLRGSGTDFTSFRVSASSNTGIDFAQDQTGVAYVYNRDNADLILGTNNAQRFRINSSGAFGLGGATYGSSGQVLTSAGSGSGPTWTTVSGTTINSNTNNYIITGTGTANELQGESGLTYDGSTLQVSGNVDLSDNNKLMIGDGDDLQIDHSGTNSQIYHNGAGSLYIAALGSGEDVNFQSTSGKMTFTTGGSERLRITDDGIKFNGDNAATNALDDYEEGTWTPVIQGTGSNNSKNYTNQIASYTKIGNMVYLSFRVSWDSRTSDTGDAIVSGFPFTVNDASNATGSLAGNNLNFNNLSDCITAAMEFSNNQQYAFILMTQDSGTWVNPSANPFWQSTGEIRGSITYRTDS